MKTSAYPAVAALAAGLIVAGCLTEQQLIERRIQQKPDSFSALTADAQQRVRTGRIDIGDPADAVWLAFGPPDRTYQRAFTTFTNEVWSYVWELDAPPEPRPVMHPLNVRAGQPPPPFREVHEYRHIELREGRVVAVGPHSP